MNTAGNSALATGPTIEDREGWGGGGLRSDKIQTFLQRL